MTVLKAAYSGPFQSYVCLGAAGIKMLYLTGLLLVKAQAAKKHIATVAGSV